MPGLPEPGDRFARYVIDRRLGRGGMGVVYAARQHDLDREVALKLLSPELLGTEEHVARFRREAMALARLESAHVVQVHDAGEHDGWLYLVTQLVPDGDLAGLLDVEGAVAPAEALALVDQVLDGLTDAHAAGVLHRDIKPSNILVRRTTSGLRLYLCDFGISQLLDGEQTQTRSVSGTLGYLAPERHRGEPATPASDLYSVGCLLWALVTGHAPYGGTGFKVALRHQSDPVPQLAGGSAEVARVNHVLARSMAKDPSQRYQSAAQMRADLGLAGPAPLPYDAAPTEFRVPTTPLAVPTPPSSHAAPAERSGSPYLLAALAGGAIGLVAVLAVVLLVLVRDDPAPEPTAGTTTGQSPSPTEAATEPAATTESTGSTEPAGVATVTVTPTPSVSSVAAPGRVTDLPDGLFCKDLAARGYSYSAAVEYWQGNGQPNQMDADRNGIPCETVFASSDVAAYWGDRMPAGGGAVAPASGLFCKDLAAMGYSYAEAVDYWYGEGQPDRMDEDLNTIPCETVYPQADVDAYWFG